MRRTCPLLDHPEFSILDSAGWREYRVENPRLVHPGRSHVRKLLGWFWLDATIPLLIALFWDSVSDNRAAIACIAATVLVYAYVRCTQVLWESVVVLPSLGLQFETHRGLPSIPLTVSRNFIPLSSMQDFIINEGLRGWNVRYYLAAIQRSRRDAISLDVAYENILPRFPVLLEVYHGVHETLLDESHIDSRSDT
ncbi:hypothetical protein B0H21DRAFT_715986 [Amylocystis lapponica]|nr:hypothetical protein B0H21DRAFT_715986 [Amylocystis lapponica]